MSDTTTEFSTIIGKDASIKGDLTFDGAAKILGSVEGTITSKGKLTVAEGADCKASIKAGEVTVQGSIEGDIEVNGRVDLQASGILQGDITAGTMTMADGASFVGTCRIGAAAGASGNRTRATSSGSMKATSRQSPEVVVKQKQEQVAAKK